MGGTNPKEFKITTTLALLAILAPFITGFGGIWFGSYLNDQSATKLWDTQQKTEQRNVANALETEINYNSELLDELSTDFPLNGTPQPLSVSVDLEDGVYYGNQNNIAAFNQTLTSEL